MISIGPKTAEVSKFISATVVQAVIYITLISSIDAYITEWGFGPLQRVSIAAAITTITWFVFIKWAWYVRPFSFLHNRPDVRGTWIGHLESNWSRDGNSSGVTLPIAFSISQTLIGLTIRSYTKQQVGTSYLSDIISSADQEGRRITYVFSLRDEFSSGEGAQQGAGEVHLEGKTLMKGEYWTNQGTKGRLILRKVSEVRVNSFADATWQWDIATWASFDD